MSDDQQDQPASSSRWRALVGLALLALLILGALYMVRELRHASQIQDCVASGRTNCAPISAGR